MLRQTDAAPTEPTPSGSVVTPAFSRRSKAPVPTDQLASRAAAVAEDLRRDLGAVVESLVGPSMRPATLARRLEIDRTLSARVVRAVRAEDSVQALHETPAPGGLRIFLSAATAAGADQAVCRRTDESVRRFERLIDEFPGGRAALDAALGGLNEGVRQRGVRAATQAIHKSMASLLGYQADVMLATILIQPSANGHTHDQVYILGKYGVRRLRAGSPITIFGRRGDRVGADALDSRYSETLDGRLDPENGNAYLLTDFCTKPVPPLSLFRNNDVYLYTLAETVPPVNVPVSLVAGIMLRSASPRFRSDAVQHQWESQVPRMPCRVLINDVFVHDDCFDGRDPVVTTTLHSIAAGQRRPDAPAFQLDSVDIAPPLGRLGRGIDSLKMPDVPHYADLVANTFDKVGWSPEKFRGYRARLQYPVPLVSLTYWFELPPAP